MLLFTASLLALSDKSLAIAIDLSGKQRMLTQEMTKEGLLIYANIDREENLKKLKESSQLFDTILRGLREGNSSLKLVAIEETNIQTSLQKVQSQWEPFYHNLQTIISQRANEANYHQLAQQNLPLLQEVNHLVECYTSQESDNQKLTLANDINLAGKQRMLTQKMAKDLLFINTQFKDRKKHYLKDFNNARQRFGETLEGLLHGNKKLHLQEAKLPSIIKQLTTVQQLWKTQQPLLDHALKGKKLKKAILGLDTLKEEMNHGVQLYTQSLKRQKQRLKLSALIGDFMHQSNGLKEQINLSGRQRMLTQRMSKLALLIALNIKKEDNIRRLKRDASLYDNTLKSLKNNDNNTKVQQQIANVEHAWRPFYASIQHIINNQEMDASLQYVIQNNESLLAISDQLVEAYEQSNQSPNYLEKARLHIVNIAGQERMLTQKMTKEKFLIVKGETNSSEELHNTVKRFDTALTALVLGDKEQQILKPTNPEIKGQLDKIVTMWQPLKPLYIKNKPTAKELANIVMKNTVLLQEIDKMVKMAETATEY